MPLRPDDALEKSLTKEFGDQVQPLETPFEIPQFRVAPEIIDEVTRFLKESGFTMLLDLGGVDYLPRVPRFEVVYHFLDIEAKDRVRLRVSPRDDENPQVPTVSHLFPAANPAEREVYDLFGIRFIGHPNLTRILMPDDWEGFPLRKDYPLRGHEREAARTEFAAEINRYHAPKLAGER